MLLPVSEVVMCMIVWTAHVLEIDRRDQTIVIGRRGPWYEFPRSASPVLEDTRN